MPCPPRRMHRKKEKTLTNPYEIPSSDLKTESEDVHYVGFWARTGASLIDTLLLGALVYPVLYKLYGAAYFTKEQVLAGPWDFFFSYVFPALAIIMFWIYKSATPGKMVIGAVIVDEKTGGKPSNGQMIGRYFSYYISLLPLGLGYLWVAWDPKKQGWHDKLAGTVVIKRR